MEVAECQSDLSGVELDTLLAESPLLGEVLEELAALDELHNEVDAGFRGEHLLHGDDEGMLHLQKNEFLNLETLK